MKQFRLVLALSAALAVGMAATTAAQAMPVSQLGAAANTVSPIQKTQFFFGGRRYCWYPGGWHGPGWYWCGYAWRRGFGWGGPRGWRGWRPGIPPHGPIGPRPGFRPGFRPGPHPSYHRH